MRSLRRVAVLAITLSLAGTLVACSETGRAAAGSHGAIASADVANAQAAAMLKQDMRKLWTEHVVWTRVYLMEAVGDQPGAPAAGNRLMKNQEDIGNAVATYYGAEAGMQLTTLLKEHISIAVDIIKAAKSSDKAGQKAGDDRWRQNADQIATFLSKANPHLPKATLLDLMNEHLRTTTDEVVARLTKNWDLDVRAFDQVYDHILKMSDAIADGVVKQFPEKFK
jgi:hypothetical protein